MDKMAKVNKGDKTSNESGVTPSTVVNGDDLANGNNAGEHSDESGATLTTVVNGDDLANGNNTGKHSDESGATLTTVVNGDALANGNNAGEHSNESGVTPPIEDKREYERREALELMARFNIRKIYKVGEYWFTDLRAAEEAKVQSLSRIKTFNRDE